MKMKRWLRLTAAALSLAILTGVSTVGGPVTVEAATRGELEAQIEALEQKEKEIKSDLAAASKDLSASKERKELLESQIENATQQISLMEKNLTAVRKELSAKRTEIRQAKKDIEKKEKEIADTHQKLGERLRTIAKTGNLSAIQRLLNTDNYTEYLLKQKAAECIARRDQQTMDELEAALADINKQKKQLEQDEKEIEAKQAEIEQLKTKTNNKKAELDTLHNAVQSEVNKLQSEVSDYNKDLAETRRKIAEADAAIEALIKSTASTGTYDADMMTWPVPTVRAISSHYGPRWGTMHRGLDIANGSVPIYGQNIVAAADGVVIAVNSTSWYGSGWSYGYGYCVIIDHGRDKNGRTIHTMYAHCSAMYAKLGQKVKAGERIAKAGNSGDVTGPHLHFEVRVNGDRVNPYPNYVSPNVN